MRALSERLLTGPPDHHGACLAALRLNEDTRVNLLLALLSSGVALYTAELALAYHLEREATARRSAQAVEASWDDRTRIQVAMDLRREGVNAYPRLSGPDLRQIQLELDGNVVQPLAPSTAGALVVLYREAKRTVEAWGGRIHLVYMPTLRRYRSWLGKPIHGRRQLLGAAAELGIPVIDLEPSFRATGEPQRLWLPGGHLNAAGYSLAAERITAEASD